MLRPRFAVPLAAAWLLAAPGAAQAAELFAQSANAIRGPGMYLNLLKFIPVVLLYLMWVHTTHWVEKDTQDLNNPRFEMWNAVVFLTGVAGLIFIFVIPLYVVGLIFLLLAYLVPTLIYVNVRNQMVPDDEKVLTPYHFGELLNRLFLKIGMKPVFNKGTTSADSSGPPVTFIGKSQGSTKDDPDRVSKAEASQFYVSAKELVYDAVLRRSTDIHMEPTPEAMTIRYRIDGILMSAEPFNPETGVAVLNIFKVLSAMDITERRKPQDGSFAAKVEGRDIDFRVATSGTKAGEKMVIRILDNSAAISKLEDVGMRPKLVTRVREIVTQPHGLFLVCGPTGSGKSTTLYAGLREIDRYQRNIITIEDPIEYHLDNITQIEVNTKAGQTFAANLRSVLRQDPDVIMIGEIRDAETAQIACQAANTGHMVFSTVHANDAVTAIFRLLDLGVEPFLLSSALSAVLAQRLVRVLDEEVKEAYKPNPDFLKKANLSPDKVEFLYRVPSDPNLLPPGSTGYFGRTGVFELLEVNDKMRDMMRENPSVNAIKAEARKNGMIYLQEDGLRLVVQGKTSIDELMRVVK